MSDQQQTLSIPSLLLLAAFTALTIRYFFFTKPSTATPRANPRGANPADVEQVVTMFPQIGRREIIWDLQRNGGSVAATTERVLSRGGLDAVSGALLAIDPVDCTVSRADYEAVYSRRFRSSLLCLLLRRLVTLTRVRGR